MYDSPAYGWAIIIAGPTAIGQEHKRGLNFPIVIETWVPRRA